MHKKLPLLLICITCLFFLLAWGCDKQESADKKTAPVAKKIIPKAKEMKQVKADTAAPETTGNKEKGNLAAAKGQDTAAKSLDNEAKRESELYNPEGRIDPFAPLFKREQVVTVVKEKKKKRPGHLTPLEKVDLSQMKLLGTILAPSGNRAMVTDASGKGYVVTVGTYMGIASGRVVEILRDRIVVEEEVENILGKISLRKRELKLQKPPGEF